MNKSLNKKLSNPAFLIKAITLTSLLTILLGIGQYYVIEKVNSNDRNFFLTVTYRDRFISKQDDEQIWEATALNPAFVPKDVLWQSYMAYLSMLHATSSEKISITKAELEKIDTPEKYKSLLDHSSIENANNFAFTSFDTANKFRSINNILFLVLIIIQTINIFFATKLFYIDKTKIKK